MAELKIDGDDLWLKMSRLEQLEGLHRDVRVPISLIREVRPVADPWLELRGIRAPGMGLPRVIAVGTRHGSFGKDFACVHGNGDGVVVDLCDEASFHRIVVTSDEAEHVAATIEAARSSVTRG